MTEPKASTQIISTADLNRLLAFYKFNGEEMHGTVIKLASIERSREMVQRMTPVFFGICAMSVYNMTRFNVLSRSGKIATVTSFLFFGLELKRGCF